MKKFTFLMIFYIIFSQAAFSQNTKFKHTTMVDNTKEIVFSIVGINDDNHAKQIIKSFDEFEEIISCQIFYNKRCKLIVLNSVNTNNADKCRKILKSNNVDFDIDYIEPLNKLTHIELSELKERNPGKYVPNPILSNQWVYPVSFPKMVDSGNAKADKAIFSKAKQTWIEQHPEEYKKMTGVEYLDYSLEINK